MEDQPKIEIRTPMEHVEQLASIGQQAQDKRKPQGRPSGRSRKPDIDQILEQEQDLRQSQDEGHIDYHA